VGIWASLRIHRKTRWAKWKILSHLLTIKFGNELEFPNSMEMIDFQEASCKRNRVHAAYGLMFLDSTRNDTQHRNR
jgi:hypothetical protein